MNYEVSASLGLIINQFVRVGQSMRIESAGESRRRRRQWMHSLRLLPLGLVICWILTVIYTREAWILLQVQRTVVQLGTALSEAAGGSLKNAITSESLVKSWDLANVPEVSNRTSRAYCDFLHGATKKVANCSPPSQVRREKRIKKTRYILGTCVGGAGSWQLYWRLREIGLLVEHEGLGLDGSVSWLFAVRKPNYPCRRSREVRAVRFHKVLQVVRCPPANVAALATHRHSTLAFAANAVKRAQSDNFAPPPDSINNIADSKKDSIDFNRRASSRLEDPQWLRFLAELWLRWNERIEKYADLTIRVEDELSQDSFLSTLCQNERCHSLRPAARISRLRDSIREISNRFFQNGLYNPARCLRGACESSARRNASARLHHRPHGDLTWSTLRKATGSTLSRRIAVAAARYGYTLDATARTGMDSCQILPADNTASF